MRFLDTILRRLSRDRRDSKQSRSFQRRLSIEPLERRAMLSVTPFLQAARLTASDAAANDALGQSVAISGNTVVVGSPLANGGQGVAYVFTEPGSGWADMTQVAELTASDAAVSAGFGESVSISGNTIVVGADGATVGGNSLQGAAYVFTEPAFGWTNMTQTAKLTASDGAAYDLFGASVSIFGNTIVAGSEYATVGANSQQGSAYIFTEPGSVWTNMTQTAELTASDGAAFDHFGDAVAISGNTVAVGAFYATVGGNVEQGAAYLFTKPAAGWSNMNQTAKLTESGRAGGDNFGISISISGNTVVVGADNAMVNGNRQGAAYLFVEPGANWTNMTQTARLTASDGAAGDLFGVSVSTSGSTVVVGADEATVGANSEQGAAYVFTEPSTGWANMTQTAKLTASDGAAGDFFGISVAIGGNTIVVGSPEFGQPSGGGQYSGGDNGSDTGGGDNSGGTGDTTGGTGDTTGGTGDTTGGTGDTTGDSGDSGGDSCGCGDDSGDSGDYSGDTGDSGDDSGSYDLVRAKVVADKVIAAANSGAAYVFTSASASTASTPAIGEEILQNGQPGFWSSSSSTWTANTSGLGGSSLISSTPNGSKESQAAWWFSMPAGDYEISITFTAGSNLTKDLGLDLYDGVGNFIGQVPVNEQVAPNSFTEDGVAWENLGAFKLTSNVFHISTWNSSSDGAIAINGIQLKAAPVVDDSSALGSQTYSPPATSVGSFTTADSWTTVTQGAFGGSHTSSSAAGNGSSTATWAMPVTHGTYEVDVTWPASASLSASATYNIFDGSTKLSSVAVDQQLAPSGISYEGLNWQSLGSFTVAGTKLRVTLSNTAADGQVSADAIRILPSYQPTPIVATGAYPGFWSNAAWTTLNKGLYASSLVSNSVNGSEQSQAAWWFPVQPGKYDVEITWTPGSNLSSTARFDIYNSSSYVSSAVVDEQDSPLGVTDQGVQWQSLGALTMTGDVLHVSTWNSQTNGAISAGGVRIVPV
jgi:hypothetical protein